MGNIVTVAKKNDVPAGGAKVVTANGNLIALFNIEGTYYAIDNTCLHRGGPLGEGLVEGETVTCPWHGWRYNVKTGENAFNPQVKVKSYPVHVDGEDISVVLD